MSAALHQPAAQKPNSAVAPGASVRLKSTPLAWSVVPLCDQVTFQALLTVPVTVSEIDQLPLAVPVLVTCTRLQ